MPLLDDDCEMVEQSGSYFNYYCSSSQNQLPDESTFSSLDHLPTPPRSPSQERDVASCCSPDPFESVGKDLLALVSPNKVLYQPTKAYLDVPLYTVGDDDLSDPSLDQLSLFNEMESDYLVSCCSSFWDDKEMFHSQVETGTNSEVSSPSVSPALTESVCSSLSAPFSSSCSELSLNSRKHLDSSSTSFDTGFESLFPQIDVDVSLELPVGRPETPSESSDADSDTDDKIQLKCRLGIIQLDHNYHFPVLSRPKASMQDMACRSPDTDDEIDVESLELCDDSPYPFRVTKLAHSSSLCLGNSHDVPDAGATVTYGEPAQKITKTKKSAPVKGPRKVGRPPKALKRLVTSEMLYGATSEPDEFAVKSMKCLAGRSSIMDPKKRTLHNSLERLRRVDLKNWFDTVRSKVPSLKDKPRAPKVLILTSAAEHCEDLVRSEQNMIREKQKLMEYNLYLKRELHIRMNSGGDLG